MASTRQTSSTNNVQLQYIDTQHGEGDDNGLADFQAVYPGINVDGVGAKHGKHPDVHIKQST